MLTVKYLLPSGRVLSTTGDITVGESLLALDAAFVEGVSDAGGDEAREGVLAAALPPWPRPRPRARVEPPLDFLPAIGAAKYLN